MISTKKIVALVLLILMLFSLIQAPVFAASIETEKNVSLKINFKNEEIPVEGAVFNIYRIASCDESGMLTAKEEFRHFNVNKYGRDDGYWHLLASTLEGYVNSENITPEDSSTTDENGVASFPTAEKKLPMGLYLVLAPRHIENGTAYDTTPFMVLLPTADRENNSWIYDLEVSPKFNAEEIPETVTRKVLKIWDDEEKSSSRPKEINVHLLKDGVKYATAVLSEENGWSYSWENLDGKAYWSLTEETVEGYETTVSRQGITFVVTNTAVSDDTTDDSSDTTKPSKPGDSSSDESQKDPSLPQTGLLWWPVTLLLCLGLLLVAIGLIRRRSSR